MMADRQGAPGAGAAVQRHPGSEEGPDQGRILGCVKCRRPITTTAARIEMSGSHAHTFTNPDGQTFEIGCFGEASGMRRVSPQSLEATWFPGYTWQIEVCATCHEQLGWLYRSGDDTFHGLMLDMLIEAPE